jgi:hypothetical protein
LEVVGVRKIVVAATAAALAFVAAGVAPVEQAAAAPLALSSFTGNPPDRSCESMGLVTWPDGSRVTSTTDVPANGPTPAYCQLTVVVPERINIMVDLPNTNWNGRYQASGNGGYAGSFFPPTGGLAAGYATSATDTGHQGAFLSGEWAWSPTGMNYAQIQDFAYRANHEMAVKSKDLINYYYGVGPTYSYWNGCSTGGREGITEAFRFPNDFDGIYAGAPAINWTKFIPAEQWPQVVMNRLGHLLPACKANAIPAAVLAACDMSDGLQDNQFDPRECNFDPQSLLGVATPCGAITQADVDVIKKIWEGPRRPNGDFLWYGLEPGASITSLAGTVSAPDGTPVDGNPFTISNDWFKWWLHKDPTFDWHTITFESFATDFDQSVSEWAYVLATNNPDLSAFKAHGGKIVIWHGLHDPLIFPRGAIDYYERVLAQMGGLATVRTFARLFLAPMVGHCSGGGPAPGANGFAAVVNWVENGVAPDRIIGTNGARTRPLCVYPQVARYKGSGSIEQEQNFDCVAQTPTAVRLRSFSAARTAAQKVILRWQPGTENGLLGYVLYRQGTRLTKHLVVAGRRPYRYLDKTASAGPLGYRLQAVRLDGTRVWLGTARVSR